MSVFDQIDNEIDQVTHYAELLGSRLTKPFSIIDREEVRGFRYASPNVVNYVYIIVVNNISLINSVAFLLRSGFSTSAAIVLRAVMENNSKLSYVVSGLKSGDLDRKSEKFLDEYFSDNVRSEEGRKPYTPISQKDLRRRNAENVYEDINFLKNLGLASHFNLTQSEYDELERGLYSQLSNFVHGRYPEMMNVFGEFSFEAQTDGNFESKDIDERIEVDLVIHLIKSISKRLKIALHYLHKSGYIKMTEEERLYVYDQVI